MKCMCFEIAHRLHELGIKPVEESSSFVNKYNFVFTMVTNDILEKEIVVPIYTFEELWEILPPCVEKVHGIYWLELHKCIDGTAIVYRQGFEELEGVRFRKRDDTSLADLAGRMLIILNEKGFI